MSRNLKQDVEHQTTSNVILDMAALWERLLHKSGIQPDDNFFDVGGNPALAIQLFAEIRKIYGREIHPLAIYHAPTSRTLAALLDAPARPMFPSLVPLKAGTDTPVFIAHGLGGSVLEFFGLVEKIQTRNPIYGLQALGSDGAELTFERIEDMAGFYLAGIRERQPSGPYLLLGYSLGGLIVLEIAQRLAKLGEQVRLLAMIDAYPYSRFLPLTQRLRLTARLARRHVFILKRLPLRGAIKYCFNGDERMLHAAQEDTGRGSNGFEFFGSVRLAAQRAREGAYRALTRYRPGFYSGAIKFVRANDVSVFPDDAAAVWSGLAGKVEVENVPGNHYEMLTKHAADIAAAVSRYLQP